MSRCVKVFPRMYVEQCIKDGSFATIDVPYVVISITEPNHPKVTFPEESMGENCRGILQLQFDDIDRDIPPYICFTPNMGKLVYDFVNEKRKAGDLKLYIVHCLAGVSRSGAIGEWIADFIELPYSKFMETNPNILPNPLVKQIMNRITRERLDKY